MTNLFAVDPSEFVAARDQLVAGLRAAGDKEQAAEVKKLRRPSVPIWALNQVVRVDRDAVETFVDTAIGARHAQDEVMRGASGDVLREAVARQRHAIQAVARIALDQVEQSGRSVETYAREIDDALTTVVQSEELSDALQRGELVSLSDGDVLTRLAAAAPAEVKPRARTKPRAPSRQVLEARDRVAIAERELDDARAALSEAERRYARARDRLQELEAESDATPST